MFVVYPFPFLFHFLNDSLHIFEDGGRHILGNLLMLSGKVIQLLYHCKETFHASKASTAKQHPVIVLLQSVTKLTNQIQLIETGKHSQFASTETDQYFYKTDRLHVCKLDTLQFK